MTDNIKIITAPDIIFDKSRSFLLIHPSQDLKERVEDFILDIDGPINLYYYNQTEDVKWLLTVSNIVDIVIVDIDNCTDLTFAFLSYILSLSKTHYRSINEKYDWSLLNRNKFYDFPNIKVTNER